MSNKYKVLLSEKQRSFDVMIDKCGSGGISGTIYYGLQEKGIHYAGIREMISIVDSFTRENQYPARCVERRSFLGMMELPDRQETLAGVGQRLKLTKTQAAFRVQLRHQYRGGWQGRAKDLLTGQQLEFESFLELLNAMGKHLADFFKWPLAPNLDLGRHIVRIKDNQFVIQILFKEYGTWQGILYWHNKKKQVNFRSYLEMILLIEEVCSAARDEEKMIDFRKAVNC